MTTAEFQKVRKAIVDGIKDTKFSDITYFSGSCVRNHYLRRPIDSIEIVTNLYNGGVVLAQYLTRKYGCYEKDKNPVINGREGIAYFNLGKAFPDLRNITIRAVMPRRNNFSNESGVLPIVYGAVTEDVASRDFTVNALYFSPTQNKYLDYMRGVCLDDIKRKIIRTVAEPDSSFKQDPVRMLRAIRIASELGFTIEPQTWLGICKNAHRIHEIPFDRLRMELNRLLISDNIRLVMNRLYHSGLIDEIMPEISALKNLAQGSRHCDDAFDHTVSVMEKLPNRIAHRLAGLYHDVGKPETATKDFYGRVNFRKHESIGSKLTNISLLFFDYPQEVVDNVVLAVDLHTKFKECRGIPSKHSIRKFIKEVGNGDIDLCLDLIDANNNSYAEKHCKPNQVKKIREIIAGLEDKEEKKRIHIPVNGKDIMKKFGLKKGPKIGKAIDLLREYSYICPKMTKDEAYAIISDALKKEQI